ncbi:MAG: ferrous iron transporter B [Firmicutes bacterium]|nr:ferrous iron transporter B [Bacillota bacterium]
MSFVDGLGKTLFEELKGFSISEKNAVRDHIVSSLYSRAEKIAARAVTRAGAQTDWDRRIDDILTSKWLGFPVMLGLLGMALWLTVAGANYPSQVLAVGLFWLQDRLTQFFQWAGAPGWLHGLLVMGMYRTVAWVVSVMLPPMAIFFPLFTLMEDLGYLPRVAFNLDRFFKKAGAHGKQALTMSMGFGCNAAGVTACRIIESPRERLIATLTNSFVPCNGRFPALIALSTIFAGGAATAYGTVVASAVVTGVVLTGITVTFLVSWLLSKTLLRGIPSFFVLELPPYRKPQIGRVLIRSLLNRTVFVLGRAVMVAAPAGAITWILANVHAGELSILGRIASLLDPVGHAIGLDGFILTAFIMGLPANEIVLPVLLMGYLSAGALLKPDSLETLRTVLAGHGWTWLTALSMMLFSLLHFPCGTTLLTIYKETRSLKWTALSLLMPLALAVLVTFSIAQSVRFLGLA